uniref:RNA polymerase Rpb2 domain-containing protein n=1 Tax=Glossina austeni TaxID=7395 RepID=A0A1A9VU66_GLOAU
MLKERDYNNYSWQVLVASGVVEYIDTLEEETVMIAMSPYDLKQDKDYAYCTTYTHREIHPAMILGVAKYRDNTYWRLLTCRPKALPYTKPMKCPMTALRELVLQHTTKCPISYGWPLIKYTMVGHINCTGKSATVLAM